ncbi:gamma carbonic anhydrase family protein [Arthrobacter agilis]|uniref:gamma carbonic anhydrase family protein n=1 Tax=Arthrobacter agilis TaxID=37921 RepID=UPI000B355C0A|nr:gamma carbonic anhydrase family protein [Arthrobacter agilis]OUM40580.1 gamma carbonic anhydrase family protein [Arthrobacter agilis]PPB45192.1 gamma carbonic anhydrase family protein [Arthrobacter agilis]TPV27892.1 gamma carbonic anhydrase family protein [Arthrobacter agilis]VDR31433.1 carnitine operon protein CaiE [Arthrobacter agilis]
MAIHTFRGRTPRIAGSAFIAPTASLIGEVTIGEHAGVFFGATLRADTSTITVGEGTNLQDNVVVHADPGFPARIGARVTVGHGAVVHGCTVEDDCLIGMSATVMNGAVIGAGSLVAAGAVVLEGTAVPPRSLVAGVPAKVRKTLGDDEVAAILENAERYRSLSEEYLER